MKKFFILTAILLIGGIVYQNLNREKTAFNYPTYETPNTQPQTQEPSSSPAATQDQTADELSRIEKRLSRKGTFQTQTPKISQPGSENSFSFKEPEPLVPPKLEHEPSDQAAKERAQREFKDYSAYYNKHYAKEKRKRDQKKLFGSTQPNPLSSGRGRSVRKDGSFRIGGPPSRR